MLPKILGRSWGGATGRLSRLGGLIIVAVAAVIVIPRASGSDSPAPLVANVKAGAASACIRTPDRAVRMFNWRTPVGFAYPTFYNRSASSLTIESVTLTDPHHLKVHGGIVYEMSHPGARPAPLYVEAPMTMMPSIANAAAWASRKPIPGATIPGDQQTNRYQIVPQIAATSPAGGWATGEIVAYEAGGRQYTTRAELGLAIAGTYRGGCAAMYKAIAKGWDTDGIRQSQLEADTRYPWPHMRWSGAVLAGGGRCWVRTNVG